MKRLLSRLSSSSAAARAASWASRAFSSSAASRSLIARARSSLSAELLVEPPQLANAVGRLVDVLLGRVEHQAGGATKAAAPASPNSW